jgi:hypothetical protein
VHLLTVDPCIMDPCIVDPSMVDRRMVHPSIVDPSMVQCRLTNRKSLGAHKLPNGYRVTKGEDPSCCASRDAASQL